MFCEIAIQSFEPVGPILLIEYFAFKQGVPADVDFAFDARCLPNPHWEPELRPLTGLEPEEEDLEAAKEVLQSTPSVALAIE